MVASPDGEASAANINAYCRCGFTGHHRDAGTLLIRNTCQWVRRRCWPMEDECSSRHKQGGGKWRTRHVSGCVLGGDIGCRERGQKMGAEPTCWGFSHEEHASFTFRVSVAEFRCRSRVSYKSKRPENGYHDKNGIITEQQHKRCRKQKQTCFFPLSFQFS